MKCISEKIKCVRGEIVHSGSISKFQVLRRTIKRLREEKNSDSSEGGK